MSVARYAPAAAGRADGGQSTAELAVVLPVLLILIFTVAQVGLVARDQLSVQHAARAAARRAAITPDESTARRVALDAGDGLRADRLQVALAGERTSGEILTVVVDYSSPTDVPFVGRLIDDIDLSASASVRVE